MCCFLYKGKIEITTQFLIRFCDQHQLIDDLWWIPVSDKIIGIVKRNKDITYYGIVSKSEHPIFDRHRAVATAMAAAFPDVLDYIYELIQPK